MFSRAKCKTCKYHMRLTGIAEKGRSKGIMCGYSIITGTTVLKKDGDHVVDSRGKNPKHCLLYDSGTLGQRLLY